jgi:hypothetical protein
MSLRTDIHRAFDEVAPSALGLPERVLRSAIEGRPLRPARVRWAPRLRGAMSLVALVLLAVTAVGILAGGRLYRDWSSFHNRQSSGLASLEARPLRLPALSPGQECPVGPNTSIGVGSGEASGNGPVFGGPILLDSKTAWGTYGYQWLLVQRGTTGLVLVRGKDLVTGEVLVFVGTFATGAVTGEDRDKDGFVVKQHHEGLLDASHPPEDSNPPEVYFGGSESYSAWQITVGLPTGSSGCVALQLDGAGFSEVFVVSSQEPPQG